MRFLIDVVPFGIPDTPPQKQQNRLKGIHSGSARGQIAALERRLCSGSIPDADRSHGRGRTRSQRRKAYFAAEGISTSKRYRRCPSMHRSSTVAESWSC